MPMWTRALVVAILIAIWCLWAVNWRKAWPVLASGGWLALLLIVVMTAYVWSLTRPYPAHIAGIELPNYGWKLAAVSIFTCWGLFCGWLQGVQGWEPPIIDLEPPAHAHGHGHHDHH